MPSTADSHETVNGTDIPHHAAIVRSYDRNHDCLLGLWVEAAALEMPHRQAKVAEGCDRAIVPTIDRDLTPAMITEDERR